MLTGKAEVAAQDSSGTPLMGGSCLTARACLDNKGHVWVVHATCRDVRGEHDLHRELLRHLAAAVCRLWSSQRLGATSSSTSAKALQSRAKAAWCGKQAGVCM